MIKVFTCKHCKAEFEPSPSQVRNYDHRCTKCRYRISQKKCTINYYKRQPWLKHLKWLRERCRSKKHISYGNYGGRGIEANLSQDDIKSLWFRDKAHLLTRPSIDRIDPNKNYEFENCRFIEFTDNCRRFVNV